MNDTNSFNEELMKLLQEDDDDPDNYDNKCLISNEKLEDTCISLECNHKFNYKHIYNEVYKQKTQPWHSEINKVKNTQLKCPYCRNIQTGLLPYREGYSKVKYVNWPPSLMMLPDLCGYVFISGKRKGQTCGKKCSGKYCISHENIMLKREKKKLEKEKKKLEKEKKKLEKVKTKSKAKLDKIKNDFNQQLNELSPAMINLVLSTPNICTVVTCAYKFKKGKSKGENCQCKKIFKDGLCKFHHKKHVKALEKKKAELEQVNQNIKIKTVNYNENGNLIVTI
tara:strand:+ start:905 stop:1747 length:843 start_codon:yes stop_codon:yes gene_type:complete